MKSIELTYGNQGFKEIAKFLQQNRFESYDLIMYDILSQSTMIIQCEVEEILAAVEHVCSAEHDYPAWIRIDEQKQHYVVGMRFNRGQYPTPSVWIWEDHSLHEALTQEQMKDIMEKKGIHTPATIKQFVSNQDKLDTMRQDHEKLNEALDQKLNQTELKLNNGGKVEDSDVDEILDLMRTMTTDRREINKQAVKCGEPDMLDDPVTARFEDNLDDIL